MREKVANNKNQANDEIKDGKRQMTELDRYREIEKIERMSEWNRDRSLKWKRIELCTTNRAYEIRDATIQQQRKMAVKNMGFLVPWHAVARHEPKSNAKPRCKKYHRAISYIFI